MSHVNIYRNRHHQVAVFLAEQDAKQRDYDIKASGLYDHTLFSSNPIPFVAIIIIIIIIYTTPHTHTHTHTHTHSHNITAYRCLECGKNFAFYRRQVGSHGYCKSGNFHVIKLS